jgi:hypothetical protein
MHESFNFDEVKFTIFFFLWPRLFPYYERVHCQIQGPVGLTPLPPFFAVILGIELRAFGLQGKCSTS